MTVLKKRAKGFTLVEVLIATAIGATLIALAAWVAIRTSAAWDRIGARFATEAQARHILDYVEADLTSLIFRPNQSVWLAADVQTGTATSGVWVAASRPKPTGSESLRLNEEKIDDCRFGAAGVWLRFFVASRDSNAGPVAVAYQIVRRNIATSTTSDISYELYRSEVSPANTFTAGLNLDLNYSTPSAASETGPGTIIRPHRNKVLADHVVDFGIRFYRRGSSGREPLYPAVGGEWSNSQLGFKLSGTSYNNLPIFAEVMVRILTEEGVRKLRVFENPPTGFQPAATWWEIAEQHSHVFTRTVELNVSP